MALEYQGLKISWLGHDGFKIKNGQVIYIDPYQVKSSEPANVLLISHEHFDHMSIDDIKKVANQNTVVIAAQECKAKLANLRVKEMKTVKPGDMLSVGDLSVEVVPAYNVNKFRAPGQPFHPRQDGKVGYVLGIGKVRIYHSGDSDHIPEMGQVKADIVLLPVSGTYVMTAEEAAQATKTLKPKLAIPMHYGTIVGSEEDARKFAQLASCKVEILKPE